MKKLEVYLTDGDEQRLKNNLWNLANLSIHHESSMIFFHSLSALASLLDKAAFELDKEVFDAVFNGKKLEREAFDKMVVFKKGANDE